VNERGWLGTRVSEHTLEFSEQPLRLQRVCSLMVQWSVAKSLARRENATPQNAAGNACSHHPILNIQNVLIAQPTKVATFPFSSWPSPLAEGSRATNKHPWSRVNRTPPINGRNSVHFPHVTLPRVAKCDLFAYRQASSSRVKPKTSN
jgi:hypothetical protein